MKYLSTICFLWFLTAFTAAELHAQTLDVTSTGINGTPIGATTPSTGAFTTLGTSGNARIGGTIDKVTIMSGSANGLTIQGSGLPGVAAWDTSDPSYIGYLGQANATTYVGSNSGDLVLQASAANVATVSSTGLIVAGKTISAARFLAGGSSGANGGVFEGFFNSSTEYGIDLSDVSTTSGSYFSVFRKSSGSAIGSITRVGTSDAVSYNTTSDARLKTHIRDFTDSGRLIDALRPRVFDWKPGGKDVIGFIAQEENAADPVFARIGAVTVGDDDPDKITRQWQRSDQALVPILVAELQALRARVAASEVALAELKRVQGNSRAAVAKLNSP